jgi:hypothetical protein
MLVRLCQDVAKTRPVHQPKKFMATKKLLKLEAELVLREENIFTQIYFI